MVNRIAFFNKLRTFNLFTRLNRGQIDGMNALIDEWISNTAYTDIRWLSYMLATVYHETGRTMQAIEEYGKGKTRPYGKKIKHSGKTYTTPNKLYYGRGLVQLTWYENYELMGRLLGYDLLNKPEMALDSSISIKIMFEGMTKGSSSIGDFTGKCVEMYLNSKVNDPLGARRIINGIDKAALIKLYHEKFLKCLL